MVRVALVSTELADVWVGLVDDAAIFPPGNSPLSDAVTAYSARGEEWYADLVGSFVVRDTDLGSLPAGLPVSVVLTSGAGAIEGAVSMARKRELVLAGLETTVRDLDDPVGNVRRVALAVRAAEVDADVPVYVEVPGPATGSWLAAADEVAAEAMRLKLRCGHVDHDLIPSSAMVAGWLSAALDRELEVKGTAGLHRAVRHEPEGGGAHGFLNLLVATRAVLDGASTEEAEDLLEERDGAALAGHELGQVRRWFTSFGSCSVTEPLDDLIALGLVEAPT
jgi:hypothetical protein